jgi:hypothetical protein
LLCESDVDRPAALEHLPRIFTVPEEQVVLAGWNVTLVKYVGFGLLKDVVWWRCNGVGKVFWRIPERPRFRDAEVFNTLIFVKPLFKRGVSK